jgi:hypothetical protein
MAKAKACLVIMEEHLPETPSPPKSKKKAKDVMSPSNSASDQIVAPATDAGSARNKRGRPPKTAKPAPADASDSIIDVESAVSDTKTKKSKTEKDEHSIAESKSSTRSRRVSRGDRQSPSAGSEPTLRQLLFRFEEQYEEMGERYREMGCILRQMRSAVANGRERTEEEIRKDVLHEVQKTIMNSFSKK